MREGSKKFVSFMVLCTYYIYNSDSTLISNHTLSRG